jgi:hypothetical protein
MYQFGTMPRMDAADVLFSKTAQRLIAALFAPGGQEGLNYAEILRRTSGGAGAIHRELKKFLAAGLILDNRSAGQRVFVANRRHSLYAQLSAIARKLAAQPKMARLDPVIARNFARKYHWWMNPQDAVKDQERLVAQVMNMGTFEDIRQIEKELGDEYLRRVVKHARPGHFDEKAWTYWHYRLGLAKPDKVPALPQRRFS